MKKLLLGLGSVASVIAPVAAVISCGVEVSVTETHGGNGTNVQTSTATVDPTLAATINGNVEALNASFAATDITKTEKVTNFVFGSMHPVTYDYAVSYTLAAKNHGLNMNIGNESVVSGINIEAGDKLVIAAKMPAKTKRAAASAAASPAMPEIHVILVPQDTDRPPTDSNITDQTAIKKLADEILLPVFPTISEELGMPAEVDLGAPGTNQMKWSEVLTKIKAVIKPTTTEAYLKLGSSHLHITFAAGANDAALKTAVEAAVRGESSFTNCFNMAA